MIFLNLSFVKYNCKICFFILLIQGYPQRMRLQRRMSKIYTGFFILFKILGTIVNFFLSLPNLKINHLKTVFKPED